MAFLSDAHISPALSCDDSLRASRRTLNWRLLLALGVNIFAWVAIFRAIAAVF